MRITDIVMDSYNRLPLLQKSVEYILARTTSPYRLTVIDDASTEGNAAYLRRMRKEGKVAKTLLRRKRRGIPANWNAIPGLTTSDIIVYTNGDVLCPDISPDWLTFGLKAMDHHLDIGMLSLNSPMCTAKKVLKIAGRRKGIVFTDRVPSFFLFIRRDLMLKIKLPPVGGRMAGFTMVKTFARIDRMWSRMARRNGYKVGYLSGVYCKHIGIHSVRNDRNLARWSIKCDPKTLRPLAERYLGL